jgi:PAS domain S-box-containing protein
VSDVPVTATLVVNASGCICQWSREAEALLGYSRAEAIGQSIELIIPPHLRRQHRAGFARYVKTGISHLPEIATSPAVHKSGNSFKVDISLVPVYDAKQAIIAVQAVMRRSG